MSRSPNKILFAPWMLFLVGALFMGTAAYTQQKDDVPGNVPSKNFEKLGTDTSYKIAIGDADLKSTTLKKIFIGKNYRKEWTQPIRVPVLHLSLADLKPTKEGGGKQTRSLRVEDPKGNEYVLRSIKKYPEKAIPEELRHTIAQDIVSDGISASYPYGALSIDKLSAAFNIPYFQKKLVYIGDDPALGEYRDKYKNTLSQMEASNPSGFGVPENGEVKTFDTEEMVAMLQKSNKIGVDQLEILRARLLDNFVMDFDRHEHQWKWMKTGSEKENLFIVVPKDHDQVFFTNQGVLPAIAKGSIPEIQGFKAKAHNQVTFNRAAINFDNYFLNGLNENQWRKTIEQFLGAMTDSLIESAMHEQPTEIQNYAAIKIANKLKTRKKHFMNGMMNYYYHLSKVVSVVGSNEAEEFEIHTDDKGSVLVSIKGKSGNAIYERVFDPTITKEIRLYGLEGDDHFEMDGGESDIEIRIIGGPGNDQFINNSENKKVWVYDVNVEHNSIGGTQQVKDKISADPMNNEFQRLGYEFDQKKFGVFSEYAFDGGVYVGAVYRMVKEGFRKQPYASRHEFMLGRTLAIKSFLFRYNADFIKAFGNSDILIRSEYFSPTSRTNFFGLGNETVFDESNNGGIKYYRARYDLANVTALARTPLNKWMDVRYGPTFQYFQLRKNANEDKFITNLDHSPIDENGLYQSNFYAGGELQYNLDTRNNPLIPTRGANINGTVRSLVPLKGSSSVLTQLSTSVSFYSDFISQDKLVIATRFGFAHNIGDYQFPQANYLGFRYNLRGYRLRRFAGRTSAFNNFELRWKVGDINTYIFPAAFGLFAYNDVGRVWVENENSSAWHDGYGAGIWVAPLNKLLITGSVTYSKEEKNFANLTFGFQF